MDSLGNALGAASGAPPPRAAGATGASGAIGAHGAHGAYGAYGDPDTPSAALAPLEPALVLGAGGRLGSALLAEALAAGRFGAVHAWVAAPLASTLRGLRPLTEAQFAGPGSLHASVAFIVFERQRFSNGRDEAFVMPQPERLPAIAQRLREGGVRRLLVVLPHASSMLPQALAEGLATRDEAAVVALGFEQLVLLKPSQDILAQRAAGRLERFAQWWLSQLRWMVPQREMPLRAAALARLTVMLARALPLAAPGTFVVPQSLLWQLAQDADGGELRLAAWLQASSSPPAAGPGLPGPAR